MNGASLATTGLQPAGHELPSRFAVVLPGRGGAGRAGRVEAPDRVLRMWSLLNNTEQEFHQVTLPTAAQARLGQQLETVTAELEKSVSPILASELRHLGGHDATTPLTSAELRVSYSGVLGWTGGLVIAMLDQLATAPARPADQDSATSSLPAWIWQDQARVTAGPPPSGLMPGSGRTLLHAMG